MNYSRLSIKVVIDYVELEIRTATKTQAVHIHKAANCSQLKVYGCDESTNLPFPTGRENTTTTVFRLRIQDPGRFHELKAMLVQVRDNFSLQSQPILTNIEIALDTYLKGSSIRELAEIAADRYRFSTHIPCGAWYFYRKGGEGQRHINEDDYQKVMTRRSIIRHFEEGWQLTDDPSHKAADTRYHVYVKTTDQGKALLPKDYRARFEVTLQGAALPCRSVEELERIDFAKLADYFKFRQLSDDLHPAAKHTLSQWSGRQLGRKAREEDKYRRRHNVVGRKGRADLWFRQSTVADDWLNSQADQKLRALTRNWRSKRAGHTGEGADFSEHSEAQTPVDTGAAGVSLIILNTTDTLSQDFPELFTHSPELEAEQERINKLIDCDGDQGASRAPINAQTMLCEPGAESP